MPSLLGSFNKLEADFDTPRAYNDYLEQVELLIYAKVYPDGGEEPKVSWGGREYTHEEHKRENAEEIRQNRRKRDDEKKARERKVAEEKERLAELHKSWDEEEMMNERDKQAKEERRMDDIVNKTPRSSPDPDRALLHQQQLQQQQQQQQQQMQRGHQHLARMYIEKLERPAAKKPRPTKDGWSAEQPRWTPGHGSHACPPWIDPGTKHKVKGKRSRSSRVQRQRRDCCVGCAQAGRRWSGRTPRQSAAAQRQAGATRLRRTRRCSSSAVSKSNLSSVLIAKANEQLCGMQERKSWPRPRDERGAGPLSAKVAARALANAERRPHGSANRQAAQNRQLPRWRFRCLSRRARPCLPFLTCACLLGMTYSALGPREQLQGPRHRRQRLSSPPP